MPRKQQEKEQDYGKKIQELLEKTQEYRKNPEKFTGENADSFLNELMDIKRKQLRDPFKGKEKPSFELLLGELQNTEEDVIHQEIKKRAMDTLVEIKGDLKTDENREKIAKAINYSELYTFIVDNTAVFKLKVDFERKRKEEKAQRAGIQDAINKGNQSELDKWKTDRKNKGFVTERNQLQKEGFEKGKIFQSCSAILTEMDELKKKDIRTAEEEARYLSDKALRDSHLFIGYMMTTRYMRKNPERDLYDEKKMQEALEKSQKELNKQATLMKEVKKGIEKLEKEINIDNFKRARGQHAADMTRFYFKKFDELFHDAEISYEKKKTKNFGNVMQALGALRDYKWNENYGKNSIYERHQNAYDKGIEKALGALDTYIQRKPRWTFLRGNLGNERLEQAQNMRKLLGDMQTEMQGYRNYVKEHAMETAALREQDDQKKKREAEKPIVQNAFSLDSIEKPENKEKEKPQLLEEFEQEIENKENLQNDVEVKSENKREEKLQNQENKEKKEAQKTEEEKKEEQKKEEQEQEEKKKEQEKAKKEKIEEQKRAKKREQEIQNEKVNQSPPIRQTVPYVPNKREAELRQRQNSDGPKRVWSSREGKFVDVKPLSPIVQDTKEENKPAEVHEDEKKAKPKTPIWDTSDLYYFSEKERAMMEDIMKGGDGGIKKKTEPGTSKKERTSFQALTNSSSKAVQTDLKKNKEKPKINIKAMRREIEETKKLADQKKRPREAEDIYDKNFVPKFMGKSK